MLLQPAVHRAEDAEVAAAVQLARAEERKLAEVALASQVEAALASELCSMREAYEARAARAARATAA